MTYSNGTIVKWLGISTSISWHSVSWIESHLTHIHIFEMTRLTVAEIKMNTKLSMDYFSMFYFCKIDRDTIYLTRSLVWTILNVADSSH